MWRVIVRIRRALRLSLREQALTLFAAPFVLAAHAAMRLLPYSLWIRSLRPAHARRTVWSPPASSIGDAVRRASRLVPGAMCLTQAIAGQTVLRLAGRAAVVQIGVAPPENGELRAHAWIVEAGGTVVVGQVEDLPQFIPFPLERIADMGFVGVRRRRLKVRSGPTRGALRD